MSETPTTSLVPSLADDPRAVHSALYVDPGSMQGRVWHSMSHDSEADQVTLLQALDGEQDDFESLIGKRFALEHLALKAITIQETKSGEIVPFLRTVLVSDKGEVFGGCSLGVLQSLQGICQVVGVPPWKPALDIEFIQTKTRQGFRLFKLRYHGRVKTDGKVKAK